MKPDSSARAGEDSAVDQRTFGIVQGPGPAPGTLRREPTPRARHLPSPELPVLLGEFIERPTDDTDSEPSPLCQAG
jgi:hypothetical protein